MVVDPEVGGLSCGSNFIGSKKKTVRISIDKIGCQFRRFRCRDQILGHFVPGDIEVHVLERRIFQDGFDCGAVVNPAHLKNQIEGAITMAIGGALFESIQFENGKILNPHFASYRVPRFSDAPSIEVVLVDHKDIPSAGAGETPIVGLAPAVGNAIFNATGLRLRSLPLVPKGVPTDAKS